MSLLSAIGGFAQSRYRVVRDILATVAAVYAVALRRRYWPQPVRDVLARQLLFTGLEASRFVAIVAFMAGISVVVQTQLWLVKLGQQQLLGPVLVTVIIRELAPLLVNFIIIGRSGTAIVTEIGNMRINGEIRVLDAQGLDPFLYLVMPRVAGMAGSIFCLTILFIVVSFTSGYLSGFLLGANAGNPALFVQSVFQTIQPADVLNVMAKTIFCGSLTATVCCMEGFSVGAAITEVPQAATRAVTRAVIALFIVSALISVLTYL